MRACCTRAWITVGQAVEETSRCDEAIHLPFASTTAVRKTAAFERALAAPISIRERGNLDQRLLTLA